MGLELESSQRLPVVIWSTPRSCSTALERAIMQHEKITVFHELFADCFFFGPDRKAPPDTREAAAALEASGLKRNATYEEQMQILSNHIGAQGKGFVVTKELSTYYQGGNSMNLVYLVLGKVAGT